MKPVQIALTEDLRKFADKDRSPTGESLAAYVRRLIHEQRVREAKRNEQSA
jgi:hypothetical protein